VSNGYVAFIRAINVGSSNRIAMARLAELFIEAGCTDVSWYLQTGNVLFDHPRHEPDVLAAKLEAMLVEAGLKNVAVIIRTSRQLADLIAANPLMASTPTHTNGAFLFCDHHQQTRRWIGFTKVVPR
jgi:uncharacterized protein (DUF1697 family)